MTLYEIYDLCNYIAGKFPTGNTFTPARFNLLLPEVQDALYNEELDILLKASLGNPEILNKLASTSILKPFKETYTDSVSAVGEFTLPTDYVRYLSGMTYFGTNLNNTSINPQFREMDFISESEFRSRQSSIFSRADTRPFAKIQADTVYCIPYDIGNLTLDYLRRPLVPYMDWCQDYSNPNLIIYMPVNSYLSPTITPNVFDLALNDPITQTGYIIYNNVIKDGITAYYATLTTELEWESYMHDMFISRLLRHVGVNLGELEVKKFADQLKQEGS